MKTTIWVLALVLGLALAACSYPRSSPGTSSGGVIVQEKTDTAEAEGADEEIPLSRVPAKVLQAARARLPGIVLDGEAERETENGILLYTLEGEVDGKEYEIEVTADGTILEVEEDEDEPGDVDDDDDDRDDDDEDDDDDRD